jgi:hypothetical protein
MIKFKEELQITGDNKTTYGLITTNILLCLVAAE